MKAENLLDDVMADAASPSWREAMLEQTLRQVRRKRHVRRCASSLAATALLIAGGLGLWRAFRPPTLSVATRRGDLQMVTTQPLRPGMLVQTHPGTVRVVATAPGAVGFVESARGSFQEINDAELFAMLRGHPAMLIKRGPNDAELILLNPEDRNGFVVR